MRRHDAKVIRDMLRPAQVLEHYEIDYAERRDQLATRHCPRCGERSRASVYISSADGAWKDHAHGCSGDLFALVAGYAGIELRRDTFAAVVALAARIAGVEDEVSPAERERILAERRQRDADRIERHRARDNAARARMPTAYARLDRRDVVGERYLRDRGLDPTPLHAGDVVRYTANHEPALALRGLETGTIVGVQYRRLTDDEPRQRVFTGSRVRHAALFGRVHDLRAGGVAVLCEGLIDTLTAYIAWPDAIVYGVPGAPQFAAVAAAVASRVAELGAILLIVCDDDRAGHAAAASALDAARSAGLTHVGSKAPRERGTVRLVDLGVGLDDRRHHDLNEAWRRSAWRWRWPSGETR